MKAQSDKNSKIKGERIAKIVWIFGTLICGLMMMNRFLSIGNAAEDTLDCVEEGCRYLLSFAAFFTGLIYLFRRKGERPVFISAVIFTAACLVTLILEVAGEGSLAAGDVVKRGLILAVYVIYAVYMDALTKGQNSGRYRNCLKSWYLPALLLLMVSLMTNLWTEVVRPAGFLWDGFAVDMVADLIQIIPVYVMSKVAKERQLHSC